MKITTKQWIGIMILGLIGQLAWLIENMYLNLFIYHTISTDPNVIAAMVAASAITATVTTIIMGSITDRVGKRKPFIVYGYLLWGFSVLGFAFIRLDWVSSMVGISSAILITSILVILWDCVMTFFGSTANDAAFNAWITDITTSQNRGRVEGVLALLPLVALMIIFGGFDFLTQKNQWATFFIVFGIIVMVGGLLGSFFIEDIQLQPQRSSFIDTLEILKPKNIKQDPNLLWTLILMVILSANTQIWMPYLMIYIQNFLKITEYTLLFAVVLVGASLIALLGGRLIDSIGKLKLFPIALALSLIGLIGMYFARTSTSVMIIGTLMMGCNMILITIANSLFRDATPQDKVGSYQGVRMVFGVMIPMIVGPFIGSTVIKNTNLTYVDLGVIKQVPTPLIFIAATILLAFAVFPYLKLKKMEHNHV